MFIKRFDKMIHKKKQQKLIPGVFGFQNIFIMISSPNFDFNINFNIK